MVGDGSDLRPNCSSRPGTSSHAGSEAKTNRTGKSPFVDDREKITVYSDYVCPFCYLGKASLDRFRDSHEDAPEPEWRPFDLRSIQRRADLTLDTQIPDDKDEAYYERAVEGVKRLAEEYGVEMDVRVHRTIDSFRAHLVALRLEQTGDKQVLARWYDAVFDALWRHGKDIGDLEVLRSLAQEIGFDPGQVDEAVEGKELKETLVARFREASRLGVQAVPTFVYGKYGMPGAVPPDRLEALVEHVRKEERGPQQ